MIIIKRLLVLGLVLLFQAISSKAQKLEFFIAKGLENSPLINEYQNQVKALISDSLIVKSSNLPQISSSTQVMYAPSYQHFGYDNAITNGGNYVSVVGVSQPILNRQIKKNRYESISIQKQNLLNNSEITNAELVKLITAQYIDAFTAYTNLQVSSSFKAMLNDYHNVLKTLVENGVYKQSDLLALNIEIKSAEVDMNQQKIDLEYAVSALRQTCGMSDTSRFSAMLPNLKIKSQISILQSPFLHKFQLDSLSITNQIASINNNYLPKISLFADAGFMTTQLQQLQNHFGYSTGITLSIPIYDGNQRKHELQKMNLQENTRQSYQQFFKAQYSQQVKQLSSMLESVENSIKITNNQLADSKNLVVLIKTQLNSGNTSIVELINALKNINSVNRSLTMLKAQKLKIINEYNYWLQK